MADMGIHSENGKDCSAIPSGIRPTPGRPSRRRPARWIRRTLVIAALAVAAPIVWYFIVRATSPFNQVRAIEAPSMPPQEWNSAPGTLRIGAWNIAHGRGLAESNWAGGDRSDKRQRILDIARVIAEWNLDIVVLNEVDFDANWSGRDNQAQMIAEAAGYRWRVEQRNLDAAIPFFSIRFGNAVLSRFPIVEAEAVDYPASEWWHPIVIGEKDGCICTIELPGGERIAVAPIHLESAWDAEEVRNGSARALADAARQRSIPMIAAGDFNTAPPGFRRLPARRATETAVSILLDSLSLRTTPLGDPQAYDMTFPAHAPGLVIDWVLVPGEWTIVSKEVIDSMLSDHRPVVMEVERE